MKTNPWLPPLVTSAILMALWSVNAPAQALPAGTCASLTRECIKLIEERVRKIVSEQLGIKESDIKNESSFVHDLGADSLDTVELVMTLENEFECEIPDEEAEKITTVQQAVDYVAQHHRNHTDSSN